MHEIAHYLKDVGVGKRVSTSFARTHHGDPRSHQEQVTDYYAAAMAIPKDSLEKRIIACPVDPYSEDFVAKMMEVYNQPNETVRRTFRYCCIVGCQNDKRRVETSGGATGVGGTNPGMPQQRSLRKRMVPAARCYNNTPGKFLRHPSFFCGSSNPAK